MPDRIADPTTSEGISEADNTSMEENVVCAACPLCKSVIALVEVYEPTNVVCRSCGLAFVVDGCPPPEEMSADDGPDSNAHPEPDAMDRWLAGEPIRSRVLSDRERLWRWCKKRPFLAGTSATLLVAVTLTSVLSAGAYFLASSRLGEIAQMRKAAVQDSQQALDLAARQARLAVEERRRAEGETASRRMAEHRCDETERRCREAERLYQIADRRRLDLERETQLAVARRMACESRSVMATNPLRSLRLATEAIRAMLREGEPPDLDAQQTFRDALSLVGGRGLSGHRGTIEALAVSSDGRWLASGGSDGTARLWDLGAEDPGASSTVLGGHRDSVCSLSFSPDHRWLVTASRDSTAKLWDLTSKAPAASPITLRGHKNWINATAISSDSRWLVTAGGRPGMGKDFARLWDLTAADPSASPIVLSGDSSPILAVAISFDCRWLVTAGEDKKARLYNLTVRYPAAEQTVLEGHKDRISAVVFSPDGGRLATASDDGTVRLWNLAGGDPAADPLVLEGHRGRVGALAISRCGRWLATGSFDKTVRLWNLRAANPAAACTLLSGHDGEIYNAAFDPNSRWLVTGSFDRTVRLWDLAAERIDAASIVLLGHTGPISALAITPDCRLLATVNSGTLANVDSVVRLWDLPLKEALKTASRTVAQQFEADGPSEVAERPSSVLR